jgi:hypothetical protein
MYLNDRLTGEALVLPFYSAQNGNNTYFNLVNTTGQYKAVKIRIVEAWNSQEVLDFNLYMSPKDHFSFNIKADGEGAQLVTVDNSCTVPEIPKVDAEDVTPPIKRAVSFRNTKYSGDKGGTGATAYDYTGEFREQVGYIEVIEMGQVVDVDLVTAITHVDGVPGDCSVIVDAWSIVDDVEGAWYADANGEQVGVSGGTANVGTTGMGADWNGGGLYGVATVINVAEGTAFGYDAVAIENLVDDDDARGATGAALHYAPGDTRPDFADASISDTATVAINGSQVTYTNGALIAGDESYNTVSAVLMSDSISNDYVVDPTINALTDWVITMPTKSHYADPVLVWTEPFTYGYVGGESGTETNYANDCQPFTFTAYDREEGTLEPPAIPDPDAVNDQPQFSPYVRPEVEEGVTPDGADPVLCSETTVVHFGASSATNTSEADEDEAVNRTLTSVNGLLSDEDQEFVAGWAVIDLSGTALNNPIDNDRLLPGTVDGGAGDQLRGLPVTGFAVIEYTNGVLGSAIANYQSSWEHKTSVVSSSD